MWCEEVCGILCCVVLCCVRLRLALTPLYTRCFLLCGGPIELHPEGHRDSMLER